MLTSRSYVCCCCCEWQYCMLFHYRQCALCSTAHSVRPLIVLIFSTDFGLFNAKPTYTHKSNKNLQHRFLQTVSVVSLFLQTVSVVSSFLHSPTANTHTVPADAMPCHAMPCLQLHNAGSQFFSTCWRFSFNSPSHPGNSTFLHETCIYRALHCQLF